MSSSPKMEVVKMGKIDGLQADFLKDTMSMVENLIVI